MRFKLLVALVDDHLTEVVTDSAREAGATGCTVLTNARGEGLRKQKTFLGLTLETQRPGMDIRYCARLFHRFGDSAAPVIEGDEIKGIVAYDQLVLKGLAAQS